MGKVVLMRRWVWCVVAGMVGVCGLVALMSWSVAATVAWWLAGWLVAVALWVCQWPENHPIQWRVVLVRSAAWPTVPLATVGLVVSLGVVTGVLVTAIGLAAAWEAGWLDRRLREGQPGRTARGTRRRARAGSSVASAAVVGPWIVDPAEAVLEVTDEVTDSDLCMAWRSSYVALDRAADPGEKLRAVQIREVLLDELGRRDAPGLEAWFRSGARAAGWPDRYLRGVPPQQRRGAC
ncbi:PE-PGRS family protein [Nocardioidaceae bacterium Broad-1]|nr:PE-PGRS family protein [Nocardioidaceae bacterium Broad-1]